jgi:hypothetical protein
MKLDMFLRKSYVLALLLVFIVLSMQTGCSSVIKGWSQESFRRPEFTRDTLDQEGLALLPVIILKETYKKAEERAGQTPPAPYAEPTPQADNVKVKEVAINDAHRIIMGEILLSKIQSMWPSLRILTPSYVLKRLNDEELTNAYRKFDRDFPKVGFDSAFLNSLGRTLNCRYLFISQIVVTESKSDASLVFIWTFGSKSVLRSVNISGQIWDIVKGRQVWEGFGVGYNRLSSYEKIPLIEEIAGKAVESLMKNIMP